MTSQAKIAANRRNAEKSTGPRTEEGKAIVAQNAVKHGLLARRAVIKDEDPAEFELYRQEMLEALAPADSAQWTLADGPRRGRLCQTNPTGHAGRREGSASLALCVALSRPGTLVSCLDSARGLRPAEKP